MNRELAPKTTIGVYFFGVLGVFLIMAGLIYIMYYYTRPAPVDLVRAAERRKNLADINAFAREQLEKYDWINQAKGVVRLPIARSMDLTIQEWQNPATAKSNLVARMEIATAPPPKVPEAPNPYE